MNRLLTILLILLFMLGQVPTHSHAGVGVLEPDGHASLAHVHFSGGHSHHHHDHDHGDHQHGDRDVVSDADYQVDTDDALIREHDADTIYFGQNTDFFSRVTTKVRAEFYDCIWTDYRKLDHCLTLERLQSTSSADRCPGLPIYLLVASLRI